MGLVSNPLFGINQAALQAAQASDSALQQGAKTAGQSSEAPAENQFSNSKVGKDLQTLIKKSKEQQSQQGAPAGEFQGPSPQYLQMLSITHNFHAAKQTMAQQKLSEITRQAESGWLPDPKQMIKLIKQSGMKVDTSPEGIKMAVSYFNQYYGEKDPVTGDSREMPKEISAMIEKTKSGQLNQRDVAQFVMGGMVKNDLRSARYAGLSNQQKAQLEQRQFDAIDKATDLKAPATERAAALGVAAILNPQIAQMSKHMLEFAEASPEGRQNQIAIASGMASPAEQEQNAKAYSDQMFQAGVPKEAADKMGYYSSHIDPATGKHPEMPPELVAQLPRISPQTLQTTALAMNALTTAGVHGDDLANATAAFQAGSIKALSGWLPKQTPVQLQQEYNQKLLSIQQQELGIKRGELTVQQSRLKIEQEEAGALTAERRATAAQKEALAKRLGVAPDNEVMKTLMMSIHDMAAIKNPTDRQKSLMTQLEDAYAQSLGLKPAVKKGWFSDAVQYEAQQGLVPGDLVGSELTAKPGGATASESDPGNVTGGMGPRATLGNPIESVGNTIAGYLTHSGIGGTAPAGIGNVATGAQTAKDLWIYDASKKQQVQIKKDGKWLIDPAKAYGPDNQVK